MQLFRQHPHVTLFAVALLVRSVYLAECARHPEFLLPTIDGASYDTFARQWVTQGLRDSTTAWHSAFYPLFLAGLYQLFGPSIMVAKIAQAILGALTCSGVGAVARRLFGSRAGWSAGLIAALYGPLVFYDLELMSAGWSVTWCVLMVAALLGWLPQTPIRRGLAHGALAGIGALIRPELCAAYIGSLLLQRGWPRPRVIGAALAAFLLAVLPVGLLNRPFTGSLTFLPVNGGLNLYLANAHDPFTGLVARPGPGYDRVVNEPKRQGLFSYPEQNRYFYYRAWTEIRTDPLRTVRRVGQKFLLLISGREITSDVDVYAAREPSRLLSALVWKVGRFGFPFGILLPLAVLGAWAGRRAGLAPVWIFSGLLVLLLLMLMPATRYRLILLPMLWILSGAGVDRLIEARRARDTGGLWRYALLLLAVGLGTGTPGLAKSEITNLRAERYRMIGQRVDAPGSTNGWLAQAWQMQPGDAQTAFFLALKAWQAGQAERARSYLDAALAAEPDYVMALMLRSDVKAAQGDAAGACADAELAVKSEPDSVESLVKLGIQLASTGAIARARSELEQALRFQPGHQQARMNLAGVLIEQGEPGRAQIMMDDLLSVDPDNETLHINAGIAAGLLDQPDRARHHFQEALRINPSNEFLRARLQNDSEKKP